jgi:hypothetical protein
MCKSTNIEIKLYSKRCQVNFLLYSKRIFNVARIVAVVVSIKKWRMNLRVKIHIAMNIERTVHFHSMTFQIQEPRVLPIPPHRSKVITLHTNDNNLNPILV